MFMYITFIFTLRKAIFSVNLITTHIFFIFFHGSIFNHFSYALFWLSEKVVKSKKVNSKSCHKFSLHLWRIEIFKS